MNFPFLSDDSYKAQPVTDELLQQLAGRLNDLDYNFIKARPYKGGPGQRYGPEVISAFQDVTVKRTRLRRLLDKEENPPPFSYEIWYDGKKLKFVWGMPDDYWFGELRKVITGNYPRIGLKRLSKPFPGVREGQYVAGGELKLEENRYRPIKGLGPDAPGGFPPDKAALRALTSALIGQNDSTAIAQVVFTPAGDNWREGGLYVRGADRVASDLKEGEVVESHINPYIKDPSEKHLRIAKAIEDQADESGFYVNIRYFVFGNTEEFVVKEANSIGNAFRSTYQNQEFGQRFGQVPYQKKDLIPKLEMTAGREWERRKKQNSVALTIPELAAVAHIPNGDIDTPNVEWTRRALTSQAPAAAPRKVRSIDPLPYDQYGHERAAADDNLTNTVPELPAGNEDAVAAPGETVEASETGDTDTDETPAIDGTTIDGTDTRDIADDDAPTARTKTVASSKDESKPQPPSAQWEGEKRDGFRKFADLFQSGELTREDIREKFNENEAEVLISKLEREVAYREEHGYEVETDDGKTVYQKEDSGRNLPAPVREAEGFDFTPVGVEREWCRDPHTNEDRAYEVKVHADDGNVYMGSDVRQELIDVHTDHPESPIWLGWLKDNRVGFHEIGVDVEQAFRHMVIFGMTGMGKSTSEKNILNQIARKGHGFCFIDPKGDTIDDLMRELPEERMDDLIYIEPGSKDFDLVVGLNFFETASSPTERAYDREVSSIVDDLTSILKAGDYWGPKMEGITTNIARAMIRSDKPFTLLDMYYVLQSKPSREAFAELVHREGMEKSTDYDLEDVDTEDERAKTIDAMKNIQGYTKQIAKMDYEEVDAVVRRIQHWVEDPIARGIVAHRDGTVNLSDAVEDNKIILVKVNVSSDDIKQVVTTAVLRRIWATIQERDEEEHARNPFFTLIDEFDDVVSDEMGIGKMLSKARSGKMGITIAMQNPSQIKEQTRKEIFGNSRTMASFGIGEPDDADIIQRRFEEEVTERMVQDIPQYNIFTRIAMEENGESILSDTLPLATFADYPPLRSREERKEYIQQSLDRHGVPPLETKLEETAMLIHDIGSDEGTQRELLQAIREVQIERDTEAVAIRAVAERFEERTGRSFDDYPGGLELSREHVRRYVPTENVEDIYDPEEEIERDEDEAAYVSLHELRPDDVDDVEDGQDLTAAREAYTEIVADGPKMHTLESTEGAISLTEAGHQFILDADQGMTSPSQLHRELLAHSFDWFARMDYSVSIVPQLVKQERPDAKGELPGEIDHSSPRRIRDSINELEQEYPLPYGFSGARDITIEAETSGKKPTRTLKNLVRAYRQDKKCVYVVPDGRIRKNTASDAVAQRLYGILADPAYIRDYNEYVDDEGETCVERTLYNKPDYLPLSDDEDEQKFALIRKGKQATWIDQDGDLVLFDQQGADGKQRGRIVPEELSNASANAFESWGRYDKYEDEWVVYANSVEQRYDTLEELEQDWQRVYQPFYPEMEFGGEVPDENDWEIVIIPASPDKPNPLVEAADDTMPQVYDGESLTPLIPKDHWDGEFRDTFATELLYDYDHTAQAASELDDEAATPAQVRLNDILANYYMSYEAFRDGDEPLPKIDYLYYPDADFGGKNPMSRRFWEKVWNAANTAHETPLNYQVLTKAIENGVAMMDLHEEAIEAAVKTGHLIHTDEGYFLAPPRGTHAKLVLHGRPEDFVERDHWVEVWTGMGASPGDTVAQQFFESMAFGHGPFTDTDATKPRVEAAVHIALQRETLEEAEMEGGQDGYRLPPRDVPESWKAVWDFAGADYDQEIQDLGIVPIVKNTFGMDDDEVDEIKEEMERSIAAGILVEETIGYRLADPLGEDDIDWELYETYYEEETSTDEPAETTPASGQGDEADDEEDHGPIVPERPPPEPEDAPTDEDVAAAFAEGVPSAQDDEDEDLVLDEPDTSSTLDLDDPTQDETESKPIELDDPTESVADEGAGDAESKPIVIDAESSTEESEAETEPAVDADGDESEANSEEEDEEPEVDSEPDTGALSPTEPTDDSDDYADLTNTLAHELDFVPTEGEPDGWEDTFTAAVDYYHDQIDAPIPKNKAFNDLLDHLRDEYTEACEAHPTYVEGCTDCVMVGPCDECGDETHIAHIEWRPCVNDNDEDYTYHYAVEPGCDHCAEVLTCAECADVATDGEDEHGAVPEDITVVERVGCRDHRGWTDESDDCRWCETNTYQTPLLRLPETAREYYCGPDWPQRADLFRGLSGNLDEATDLVAADLESHSAHRHLGDRDTIGRGWTDHTANSKKLGWIPGKWRAGVDHLLDEGYTPTQLIATGLFRPDYARIARYLSDEHDTTVEMEDLPEYDLSEVPDREKVRSVWRGRYLFPYHDEDGQVRYCMSRTQKGRPHPNDYRSDAKYLKQKLTDANYCEEPIYGVDTIREGRPVIITEGIADAIAAHELELPAISPVTTQFKDAVKFRLLDILAEHDVSTTLLIQDNEAASFNLLDEADIDVDDLTERMTARNELSGEDLREYIRDQRDEGASRRGPIGEALEIGYGGPGEQGALATAAYLTERGVDCIMVELPRIAGRKVDLDDYLTDRFYEVAPPSPGLTTLVDTWRAASDDEEQWYEDRLDGITNHPDELPVLSWINESIAWQEAYVDYAYPDWFTAGPPSAGDDEWHETDGEVTIDPISPTSEEDLAREDSDDLSEEMYFMFDDLLHWAFILRDKGHTSFPLYKEWRSKKTGALSAGDFAAKDAGIGPNDPLTLSIELGLGRFPLLGSHVAAVEGLYGEASQSRAAETYWVGDDDGALSRVTPLFEGLKMFDPRSHPDYAQTVAGMRQRDVANRQDEWLDDDAIGDDIDDRFGSSIGGPSDLFGYSLAEITGKTKGYRGPHPHKHFGDSENYFVMLSNEVAYDHKRKATFNALTYFAHLTKVRGDNNIEGPFTDEEILQTWVRVKDKHNFISDDDRVPRRAFIHAAKDMGIASADEVETVTRETRNGSTYTRDELPVELWNETVEQFPKTYGVDSGYSRIVTEADFVVDGLTQENSMERFAEYHITDEKEIPEDSPVDFLYVKTKVAHEAYQAFCEANGVEPKRIGKIGELVDAVGCEKSRRQIGEKYAKNILDGATLTESGWQLYKLLETTDE
ncbi:hypothetical protein C453_01040 [Haloferax elongans ATCC BAA-1513]|uniref:Uncharacterized protein n=1 Tax=Haloferax elongans ATCC BAA-1513 TaxID=1230453 RepID=M0HW12_HALEO|nr:DUF87 domain-containing protein [Haloferax elongans]ELZ88805.1 hypothetical protein C453_01040 [Haloferax elongans ATCC BAA-1513]